MANRRARICIIAPEFIGPFPNGGVGTACYWEAVTLAHAGFDVRVLYTGPTERATPEHWERTYRAAPFAYVDLWQWAAGGPLAAVTRTEHPCAEARTAELVYRFLQTREHDLLLFQEFLGHGARTLQARRSGDPIARTPALVTLHSCRQWIYEGMERLPTSPADLFVDFLERESARLADGVIAPSAHMRDWADAHWRLAPSATVVPYCYNPAAVRPAARTVHDGPFTQLVFFGRLETRKGLHVFCRALAAHEAARGPVRKVTFLGKRSTVEGRPSEEFIRSTVGRIGAIDVEIIDTLGSLEALAWLEQQRDTLVVAPSMVDNLPFAVIELFTRRIPLLSTRIGGIPEIVGASNAHLLAEPTPTGLATTLARVHADGHLVTDYRDGYSIAAANASHLEHVRAVLGSGRVPRRPAAGAPNVVVVDADAQSLAAAREEFVARDSTATGAGFLTWDEWCGAETAVPAIFTRRTVRPREGAVQRLLAALGDPRVAAATSYYVVESGDAAEAIEVAPLGPSLESGWTRNVFGGPLVAATPGSFATFRRVWARTVRFWPAYAALAGADLELALIPAVLYESTGTDAREDQAGLDAIAREYGQQPMHRLDWPWVMKYLVARNESPAQGHSTSSTAGRALYDHLLAIPEPHLAAYAGLHWTAATDPFIDDMRRLRERLASLASLWRTTRPRVFVYGAGEHARLMLALEPELGRHIAGFIDRRPLAQFLGRPCIRPDALTPVIADAVLYSSREFERQMHARLSAVPVDHILLYTASPAAAESTTASRLRRRFGHERAAVEALRARYRPPAWAREGIGGGDAEFLLELMAGVGPRLVLELGVAAGIAPAALLFSLDGLPGTVLDTTADARRISHALPPASIDLAFIHVNQRHPWPLLDLLHVTALAKPASWVALDGIEPRTPETELRTCGAMWLFEAWPFNKIHGVGDSFGMGAVQLPAHLRELIPFALELLERPWEETPTQNDVELPAVFAEVSQALSSRLAQPPVEALAG